MRDALITPDMLQQDHWAGHDSTLLFATILIYGTFLYLTGMTIKTLWDHHKKKRALTSKPPAKPLP